MLNIAISYYEVQIYFLYLSILRCKNDRSQDREDDK
jgi:hypothetical protein